MFFLILSMAAVSVGAYCAAIALPLARTADTIGAWLLICCADVVTVMLVTGWVLRDLRPIPLTAVTLVLSAIQGAGAARAVGPVRLRARSAATPDALRSAVRRSPRHPFVLLLGMLVLAQYLWRAALGSRLPEVDWDGLWYHLVGPDVWLQNHAITHVPQSIWADVYPADQELVTTWVGTFLHTVRFAWASQLPFVALGMTACAGIARHLGARRSHSALAGIAFGAIPAVFVQGATSYTDVAAAATALATGHFLMASAAALREHRSPMAPLILTGVALGLGIGVKSSNLLTLALAIPFVAVIAVRHFGRSIRPLAAVSGLSVPVFLLGGFWYARTWANHGNPFYPFTMFGFQGQGTIKALIMDRSTLPALRHDSTLDRILISWQGDLSRHPVAYDEQIGGFGLPWLLILLPAIVVAVALLVRRRRWDFLAGVALPVLALFVASPGPWWPRYLIVLPALGGICLAFVLSDIPAHRRVWSARLGRLVVPGFVVLAAVSMWWATSPTQYLAYQGHGAVRALGVRAAAKLVLHPDSRVPIYRSTEFRSVRHVPAGAGIAVVGPDFEFVHPLIGDRLTRRAVRIADAGTSQDLAAAMRAQHADYVLLARSGADKRLYTSVARDLAVFHRVTVGGPVFGSDLFELRRP